MKGLDLHRTFFWECGQPLLKREFPAELEQIAVASVGFGSDRLGADDKYSRDHCWEPGFQVFSNTVPREILKKVETYLCDNLPSEFRGVACSPTPGSPNSIRAWTIDEFYSSMTSFSEPPPQDRQWLLVTDEALCHVTNGEVFYDPVGEFTRRREGFASLPENVWRFKLAGRAMRISTAPYSMERLITHSEPVGAHLAMVEGLHEIFHFICLVNKRHAPYDRWLPWTARRLPLLAPEVNPLVDGIMATTDVKTQHSLLSHIEECCAEFVYTNNLAEKKTCWWIDLRNMVQGELRDFPVPTWVGVEYRYASQFHIEMEGGGWKKLMGE